MTTEPHRTDPPPDVCLLLRAHAEARWLSNELVPVVRQLEQNPGAATAVTYLEVLRLDARRHAAETDAARLALDALEPYGEAAMYSSARRYHAEARWLSNELVPVVRQLEQNPGAATAVTYLEVLRLDARRHAAETDAARLALDALEPYGEAAMYSSARRYHAAVRRLRTRVDRRVTLALASVAQPDARIA